MKISKKTFNIEAVKKMSKKEFVFIHSSFSELCDLEAIYYEICGKPAKSKEKEEEK